MAECPLKNSVVEKDPDKSRPKCSLPSATVDDNVDGCEASKAHSCEMPKRVGQEEGGVTKAEEELLTISDSKFQALLQEASLPLFDRNPERSPLLKKVINETDFKESSFQAGLGRAWGCRRDGGGKRSEKRTRLDSSGHGGNSAAACTTQGGSLQNLHGKPESKKLHKSGSLIAFPASSGIDAETYFELEHLKQILTSTEAAVALGRRNSGSVPAGIRAKGPSTSATSASVCDGVRAETAASALNDPTRECHADLDTHSSPDSVCSTGLTHSELKTFDRGRSALDQKAFSKSTEEEEDAEVMVEEIEMMDIDRSTDDLDSETLPLLRNGLSDGSVGVSQASDWVPSKPFGCLEGFRSKTIKSLEVDASVSMPLSLKPTQSISYMPSKGNSNTYGYVDHKGEHRLGIIYNDKKKLENEMDKSNGATRLLDENGNPNSAVVCTTLDKQSRDTDKDGRPISDSGGVDLKFRRKKKACKQIAIDPVTLPGYFGEMPIEDILKRINSTEDLDEIGLDPKKKVVPKDKDSLKPSGTKIKKTAPSRDVSKKNLENDMSRLNGSKENIIGHGLKDVLIDSIADGDNPITLKSTFDGDCKPNDQILTDKSLKPKNDELSHQLRNYVVRLMKPNADILVEAFPLSTYLDLKEDGASKYPETQGMTNHVNSEEDAAGQNSDEKLTSVQQPVSSFAVDFYSNPEALLVLEDSEFCEVKKKKKYKPRSAKNEVCGGAHYKNYYYASSGGDGSNYSGSSGSSVVNEDGRRTQPASWANLANLPHHYRNQRGLEDARRKSTSSVPHSEHSSADNSDVESVHSLPVSSTTPKTVIGKTSSSSSCTPQASYADIAKMATNTNSSSYSSRRPLTGPASPLKPPDCALFLDVAANEDCDRNSPNNPEVDETPSPPCETKCDASTSTADAGEVAAEASVTSPPPSPPSPPSDQCERREPPPACEGFSESEEPESAEPAEPEAGRRSGSVSRSDQNGDINKGVLDFINSESLRAENLPLAALPAVPIGNAVSISAIEASSLGFSAVAPAAATSPETCRTEDADSHGAVGRGAANSPDGLGEKATAFAAAEPSSSMPPWGFAPDAGCRPGVVFVGALDLPTEELSEVTFGFDVNEELLRMTVVHWQGMQTRATTAAGGRTETQVPSRSPDLEEDTTVYHFTSSNDDAAAARVAAGTGDDEDFGAAEESPREMESPPLSSYAEDTMYFNYQNVVDFIGRAWDGVQEELEKESHSDASNQRAKVQYYSRTK